MARLIRLGEGAGAAATAFNAFQGAQRADEDRERALQAQETDAAERARRMEMAERELDINERNTEIRMREHLLRQRLQVTNIARQRLRGAGVSEAEIDGGQLSERQRAALEAMPPDQRGAAELDMHVDNALAEEQGHNAERLAGLQGMLGGEDNPQLQQDLMEAVQALQAGQINWQQADEVIKEVMADRARLETARVTFERNFAEIDALLTQSMNQFGPGDMDRAQDILARYRGSMQADPLGLTAEQHEQFRQDAKIAAIGSAAYLEEERERARREAYDEAVRELQGSFARFRGQGEELEAVEPQPLPSQRAAEAKPRAEASGPDDAISRAAAMDDPVAAAEMLAAEGVPLTEETLAQIQSLQGAQEEDGEARRGSSAQQAASKRFKESRKGPIDLLGDLFDLLPDSDPSRGTRRRRK